MNNQRETVITLIRQNLEPIAPYLDDNSVTDIHINRHDTIFVSRQGKVERVTATISESSLSRLIILLGKKVGKDVKPSSVDGIIDCQFEALRVAAILSPTAVRGDCLCIRRKSNDVFPLDSYVASGRFDPMDPEGTVRETLAVEPRHSEVAKGGAALASWLKWAVATRQNFLVGGATGSGKTALMNSLLSEMDPKTRVITVEDTHELVITLPNVVHLESNLQAGVTARMCVMACLRMNPERIIMGEIRGPEAFDLMRAVNSGHRGSFATLHANSASDVPTALEKMIQTAGIDWPLASIRSDIARAFPYIIFAEQRANRSGVVSEVVKLDGIDEATGRYNVSPIFERKQYESFSIAA